MSNGEEEPTLAARRRWIFGARHYGEWLERMNSVPKGMEDVDFIALGVSIALKRNERKYREIAPEIGLPVTTVSRAEHGKSVCRDEFLLFCKWLNQEPEDFVLRRGDRP